MDEPCRTVYTADRPAANRTWGTCSACTLAPLFPDSGLADEYVYRYSLNSAHSKFTKCVSNAWPYALHPVDALQAVQDRVPAGTAHRARRERHARRPHRSVALPGPAAQAVRHLPRLRVLGVLARQRGDYRLARGRRAGAGCEGERLLHSLGRHRVDARAAGGGSRARRPGRGPHRGGHSVRLRVVQPCFLAPAEEDPVRRSFSAGDVCVLMTEEGALWASSDSSTTGSLHCKRSRWPQRRRMCTAPLRGAWAVCAARVLCCADWHIRICAALC